MSEEKMNIELPQSLKEYILDQSTERKILLLEDAYDQGFGVFWGIADILLKAPCGIGGGLPTEMLDEVFQKKSITSVVGICFP